MRAFIRDVDVRSSALFNEHLIILLSIITEGDQDSLPCPVCPTLLAPGRGGFKPSLQLWVGKDSKTNVLLDTSSKH